MKKSISILFLIAAVLVTGILLNKEDQVTESISIGVSLPLTGQAAHYGESTKKGIELALDHAKQKFPSVTFETYFEDNQFNPKVAVDGYNNLRVQHKIDAILVQTSPAAVAISPISNKDNILLMAISASADTFRSANDLTFRTTGGTNEELEPMVNLITSQYNNIGLIYMNNEIGVSMANGLRNKLKDTNVTVSVDEGFAVDATGFNANIIKLKQNNVQAVYVAGLASHATNFLKQAKDLNLNAKVLMFRTAEDPTLIKNAGILAEGVIFTSGFNDKDTSNEVTSFISDFNKKFGMNPDNYAAEGYAGAMWVFKAFNECNKDYVCIFNYLSTLQNEPSVFGNINFDQNGDIFYPFILKTVKDGNFVKY